MDKALNIPASGALDFLSLGALVHRLDPGIIPFRKATACDIHVSGGEFNFAANLADCFRLSTGVASAMVDYPIGDLIAGARPRDGRDAVLQEVRARRRPRPEHGHRLQRPRPRRPRRRSSSTTARTRRRRSSSRATSTGTTIFARRRALVPLRRHLRGALRDDRRAHRRGDAGGEGGRRGHLVRPELPREALEDLPAAPERAMRCSGASSSTSTCWSATKRTCRRASASPARTCRDVEARPERLLRHDRQGRQAVPAASSRRHDAARGPLDQPAQLGRGGLGRRPDATCRRRASWTSSTASAAATASPRASSTAC